MTLAEVMQKDKKLVIGLMGGTSADGVDAALVEISGCGRTTKVKQLAFAGIPFAEDVRQKILHVASGTYGGSEEICKLSFLLGSLYKEACLEVIKIAGLKTNQVDLIGSHGQTVFHLPTPVDYLGHSVCGTLQIGEPSILCEEFEAIVVSDFRVRDMAAGGQGAPLVPYTEYLLYQNPEEDIALQNIGGIGNITFIPKNGTLEDMIAFDTGPGNMLMDLVAAKLTDNKLRYDPQGSIAAKYAVNETLLLQLMNDPYLALSPPKTSGREHYSTKFLEEIYHSADRAEISLGDVLRTLTRYTASTIAHSIHSFLPKLPQKLIVGGGGSYNQTLLDDLRSLLPEVCVLTQEDVGFSSDAKEAVAFAVLANEAVHGFSSNVPAATGASHPVVLGKISQ